MQRYEQPLAEIVLAVASYLGQHRDRLRHDDVDVAAFIAVHTVDAATHAGVTSSRGFDEATLIHHVTDLVLAYLVGPTKVSAG